MSARRPATAAAAGRHRVEAWSRARRELGWAPTVDAPTAIRELLEGWKRRGAAGTPPLSGGPLLDRRSVAPTSQPDPARRGARTP